MLPVRDGELLRIVNASLDDATRRAQRPDGSSWLACRPGCTPCCHGVFRISALDAERLRAGLGDLEAENPDRTAAIHSRADTLTRALAADFPGDPATGLLFPEDERWETFADLPSTDAACPVLDPATGRCDLYQHRPLTCRVFGPPVMNEGGIGVCELCYIGASESEILAGEMLLQHHTLEEDLASELPAGETLIAWAVRTPLP